MNHSEMAATAEGVTLTVEGKQFGRGGRVLFPNFQMALPDAWQGREISLRDLLDGIVRAEVARFQTRQQERTLLQALTATQIADGVMKGKIDSGGRPDEVQEVSVDASVENALQAFEDGLFFVFVDEGQKEALEDRFSVEADTRVTFLRLVALAGG